MTGLADAVPAIIDPSRTREPLEKRLAETANERHRAVLGVVIQGHMKQLYPGAQATAILGIPVDDASADYLVVYRQLLRWPIDSDAKIIGEDSYFGGVLSVTPVAREDLPQQYIDLVHAPA